jgi:hypothetical protein
MKRGEFEQVTRDHLDNVLNPRGFTLTAQPPEDVEDAQPAAVYEARPQDFVRRYPTLGEGMLDQPCIDLWIKQDRMTGSLTCELEGVALVALLEGADLLDIAATIRRTHANASLAEQLDALALGLAAMLDATSE